MTPEETFYEFELDQVVPDDHLVCGIAAVPDLSWVHFELATYYSRLGRPSIDRVLMIRILIGTLRYRQSATMRDSVVSPANLVTVHHLTAPR